MYMSIFDRIVPIPQSAKLLEGKQAVLGIPGKCLCSLDVSGAGSEELVKSARQRLEKHFCRLINDAPACGGEVRICLERGEAPQGITNPDQGYRLQVSENAVTVTGFGAEGLFYGVVTLCQLMALEAGKVALPAMEILDYPDLRTRGHMIECRFGSNLMTLEDWKKVVDDMAAMKQNQIAAAVYGCWNVQYDGRVSEYLYVPIKAYPQLKTPVVKRYYSAKNKCWVDEEVLPPMFEEDFFGELVAYGKSQGVEILPLVNSYGHNTLIPATFPEISAKDENGEPQLTGLCTRKEKTYEVLFTVYDEIIDRYLKPNGITSFHIGLDEVRGGNAQNAGDIFKKRNDFCQCPLCKDASKAELYLEHALKLIKHLKSKGMKNIYIYHDMMRRKNNVSWNMIAGDEGLIGIFDRMLQENDLKDNVIIDWWTYSDIQERLNYQTTEPQYGQRRTVKPMNGYYHWNLIGHTTRNVQLLSKIAHDEGCEGMQSYSAWDESFDRTNMTQANFAWNYEATGSAQKATDLYVKARFGTQFAKAKRACELFEWIMEARKDAVGEGDDPAISSYSLMMQTLGYYWYSYVVEGKPYPRNFPGEAISKLLSLRRPYERAINAAAAMAKEAEALWQQIALDPEVDQKMAQRFAYDAANYRCLAEDYLALLQMHDLSVQLTPCSIAAIRTMAAERKTARLQLMAALESNKEAYLIPSHQRNHTIFMQMFADLESYLANTAPQDVQLNFEDLSNVFTPAFWKLR